MEGGAKRRWGCSRQGVLPLSVTILRIHRKYNQASYSKHQKRVEGPYLLRIEAEERASWGKDEAARSMGKPCVREEGTREQVAEALPS